jgi:hypothetical protein
MGTAISRHSGQQLSVEKARDILAKCVRVDEAKQIRDHAAAIAVYLRKQKAARGSILDAQQIEAEAERRIGELTRELPKAPAEARAGKGAPRSAARTSVKAPALAALESPCKS